MVFEHKLNPKYLGALENLFVRLQEIWFSEFGVPVEKEARGIADAAAIYLIMGVDGTPSSFYLKIRIMQAYAWASKIGLIQVAVNITVRCVF